MDEAWSVYTRRINSRESRKVGKALRDSGYDISNEDIFNRTAQSIAEYFFPPLPVADDPNWQRRGEVLTIICEAAGWIPSTRTL